MSNSPNTVKETHTFVLVTDNLAKFMLIAGEIDFRSLFNIPMPDDTEHITTLFSKDLQLTTNIYKAEIEKNVNE